MQQMDENKDNESHSDSTRRPRKALTLAERIAVIQQYDRVQNTRELARMFGCGRTQIQNILRRRDVYMKEWRNIADPNRIRSRRSAHLLTLGAIVYEWLQRSRCHGLRLSEGRIRQTALEVAKVLKFREFRATNSWYERLKKKYNIYQLGPSPYMDPFVLKKSLKVEDIILDLKNPKANNFINLPEESDLLDDFGTPDEQTFTDCTPDKSESDDTANMENYNSNEYTNSETGIIKSDPEPCVSNEQVSIISNSSNEGQDMVTVIEVNEDLKPLVENQNADDIENMNLAKRIQTYNDALKHLTTLEEFVLYKEDIRAIGLINQLENLFKERLEMINK